MPEKIIPARGGGASGEPMCVFYFMKKGRKIPPAGVPPAEGVREVSRRKEEFYRGLR